MALENAKRFLKQVMNDADLRARVAEKELAEVAVMARELRFDVTAEELDEAVRELRQAGTSAPKELSPDEMNGIAGGAWWSGEDAPDGHEMGCVLTYHSLRWQIDNNIWCNSEYFCAGHHYDYEPDFSGDN